MKSYVQTNSMIQWLVLMFTMLLAPSVAHAHVGVGQTGGFMLGLAHPVTGLDHIAAMVAVGLWAAQRGGRGVWIVPLSFVMAMSVGGAIGATGISIPFVEPGIGASVLVLGLLIAAAVRMPLMASSVLVGLFAVFHGHAHGSEMPVMASGLAYGIGFMLSTALLHGCGIGLGLLSQRLASAHLVRYAGGATAAFGIYLFIA
jgi:urease accessory protein